MSSLGKKIKELRKSHNMTIKELSKVSGVGQSTISEIETGKAKNPKSETLSKLASVLNVTVDSLLAEKWDDQYNPNGKLAKQVKFIESLIYSFPFSVFLPAWDGYTIWYSCIRKGEINPLVIGHIPFVPRRANPPYPQLIRNLHQYFDIRHFWLRSIFHFRKAIHRHGFHRFRRHFQRR